MMKIKIKYIILIIIGVFTVWWLMQEPSNDKEWNVDQAVLPYAEVKGNLVKIYNIRNFNYRSTSDYDIDYYDKVFDLDKIKNVYFIVEPFSKWGGAAHTFLSFEFEDDEFVAVSVEIRKEIGEEFSALKGLLNQYEIMYVWGDERDLVRLRSNYRKDDVFVYLANTTKEKIKTLFTQMIARTNNLKMKPEFYNTLTNTCTTNIVSHINTISPNRVPFSLKILAPGYSDELGLELGLIGDGKMSLEELQAKYKINDRAMQYANSLDFSSKIRK